MYVLFFKFVNSASYKINLIWCWILYCTECAEFGAKQCHGKEKLNARTRLLADDEAYAYSYATALQWWIGVCKSEWNQHTSAAWGLWPSYWILAWAYRGIMVKAKALGTTCVYHGPSWPEYTSVHDLNHRAATQPSHNLQCLPKDTTVTEHQTSL